MTSSLKRPTSSSRKTSANRLCFRLRADQTGYENAELRIQIINRLPNALDVMKSESATGWIALADAEPARIRPRGIYEFGIQLPPELLPESDIKDTVTITIANNKQVFTRSVAVIIRAPVVEAGESRE